MTTLIGPWARLRAALAREAAAERRCALLRAELDDVTSQRDAYAYRLNGAQELMAEVQGQLRDQARLDRRIAQLAAANSALRDTIAAMDRRNDELRRAVAHWEQQCSPCARVRGLIERDGDGE